MKYMIYAWDDILRNKRQYIIFFVQLIAIFVLMNIGLNIFGEWYEYMEKNRELEDKINNTYYTSLEELDMSEEKAEIYKELNEYVYEVTKGKAYSFMATDIILDTVTFPNEFVKNNINGINTYEGIAISTYLQEYFEWSCIEGELLNENDNADCEDYINVLMGYDFVDYYEVGDIIDGKYRVKGFLNEGVYYLNPRGGSETQYTGKAIIYLMNEYTIKWHGAFLNQLNVYTNTDDILDDIINKAEKMGVDLGGFRSSKTQYKYLYDEAYTQISIFLSIAGGLLLLAVISMMAMLGQMIEKRNREFVIHMMCGAIKKDICCRIILQVLFVITAAIVCVFFLFRDITNTLLIVCFSILLTMVIIIKPLITIKSRSLSEMIKRKE